MEVELPLPSSMPFLLRGPFLALWNTICAVILFKAWGWTSEIDQRRFVLYFQPYLPFCVMLWLWSVNVRIFERLHVPYEKLFGSEDAKFLVSGEQLSQLGITFLTVLFTACAIFLTATASGAVDVAESVPWMLISAVVLLLICPFPASLRSGHTFFIKTLRRVMLPIQSVSFADFLMADVMTSLARSLADLEHVVCYLIVHFRQSHHPKIDPAHDSVCYRGAWHASAFLALPYLIRMIQCFWLYRSEGDPLQLFNALKYITAFPVILSSMMKHYALDAPSVAFWVQIWFLASVINTAFSFYWDIEMDWDIRCFRRKEKWGGTTTRCWWWWWWWPQLPPDTTYSPTSLYYFAMLTNFIIRIAWIYKLSVHLHYSLAGHLVVALLEVLRRCQWIFLRIECGLRKESKEHHHHHHQSLNKQLHTKV